jgi:hypothetical protein
MHMLLGVYRSAIISETYRERRRICSWIYSWLPCTVHTCRMLFLFGSHNTRAPKLAGRASFPAMDLYVRDSVGSGRPKYSPIHDLRG